LNLPLAVLGLILGSGTLLGMLWFHQGATHRAAIGMGVTWAAFMLTLGGWMVPAAEPYRTSRRVGQRLGALCYQTGIEPVLLNYQEPGVFYAMGGPVATVRDPESFFAMLKKKRALLSVITPLEADEYRTRFGLDVTTIEDLEGFSLTKGLNHRLQIAIIRPGSPAILRQASTARSGRIEQSQIK
jgi:hypothetical protein